MQSQVFWSYHFIFAWKRLDAILSDLESLLHVCTEKGLTQSQVVWSHHFMFARKRLDAISSFLSYHFVSAWKRLNAIPRLLESSLQVCMEKACCNPK